MKRILYYFSCLVFYVYFPLNTNSQQYSIEQYLSIKGAGSPGYSFDDSRIYFTMSISGTSQLYYVNKPGDEPVRVTFFKERITGYSANPMKDLLLVESDEGGSEYNRFYLMNGSGSDNRILTDPKPKILYGFGMWAESGNFYIYYSNKRSPYFYDIYTYNTVSGKDELIFTSDHSNYPSVISADGKYLVFTRSYTTYDNDLYMLDMNSRSTTLITTHDNFNEPAEFYACSFDKAGKNLYFISNEKNNYFRLGIYNLKSGRKNYPGFSFLNNYRNSDIQRAVFSGDKTKMIVQVNDQGYDRLFMYDLLSKKEVKIPDVLLSSSITAICFANTGPKVIIGINSAANPSILYEWNYSTGAVEQITFPVSGGIDPSSFIEPVLSSYKSFDGLDIPVFVYMPESSGTSKIPCIIAIHGGPESQATYGFSPVFQFFVNSGYAVFEPNVRGSSGYGKEYAALDNVKNRENSVKDIAYLVEYIKSRGDIDPGKIAVYGGSYGGYMVLACLTLYPDLFAAGIDNVGISNFVTFLENTSDYRRNNRESEYGSLINDRDFLESISPINKVKDIRAPLMLIHGRNDPRVPVTEAEQMYNAVIKNSKEAELHIYEDEGHGISKQKNRLDIFPKIVKFLDKYVKNK